MVDLMASGEKPGMDNAAPDMLASFTSNVIIYCDNNSRCVARAAMDSKPGGSTSHIYTGNALRASRATSSSTHHRSHQNLRSVTPGKTVYPPDGDAQPVSSLLLRSIFRPPIAIARLQNVISTVR